ncbi:gasdermin-E isoform X1 [Caretta caretta]|uniref:gasdermin-E isoform X1 n=1 Tax=Caretta caretta TaxID=8467 RepID=UPI0020959B89|nr:gasdermin-E isoform X1 [Caretta caretta]XP_048694376.1 gasdermin-E isoform X1 [Caretta caretta]
MFAKATKNFVRETDCGGDLIPVSRLNDSDKLQLLNLVTKKKKLWCWQKPKYHFLTVTLNDVLTEDKPIKPGFCFRIYCFQVCISHFLLWACFCFFFLFQVVVESDFVKYEGKFEDFVRGSIETSFGKINLGAGGKGFVESQSSFGNLKKQEADLQQLMKDLKGRTINLNNNLLQQVLGRKHEVLCILTEKIVTTQKCLVSEHIQTEEKYGGVVGLRTKIVKVSVSENGNVRKDSNVVLEIPAPTTIAYGITELYIKRDGQFEFCLLNEQEGGFERENTEGSSYPYSLPFRDSSFLYQPDAVDSDRHSGDRNIIPSDASLSVLKQDLLLLKMQFQPFVKLPEDKQGALNKIFYELLHHEEIVIALEEVLDSIFTGEEPDFTDLKELKPPQQQNITDFLQLVGYSLQNELLQKDQFHYKGLFSAAHILISAVAELSDYTLALLRACCDIQIVPILCCLPNVASADGTLTLRDPALAPLTDTGRFHIVQRLFALSNINLEMMESSMKAVTMKEPSFFPFILYIALYGFYALGGTI